MSRPIRPIPDKTQRDQARASRPDASAWVAANAGSGKTTVLVRRVLRLLLAGVDPGRILCLTFTTAAAANMASRLFEAMAGWVRLDDEALAQKLGDVLEQPPTLAERNRARILFAEALETPGGLKIETIHAFCTRLLQVAPFEAAVPAHFSVISQTDRAAAIEAAIARVLGSASDDPALKASLDHLAGETDGDTLRCLIDKALARKAFLVGEDGAPRPLEAIAADLRRALGVAADESEAGIVSEGLQAIERAVRFADLAAAVDKAGTKNERADWADHKARAAAAETDADTLALWWDILLTAKETRRAKVLNTGALATNPSLAPAIKEAVTAIETTRNRLAAFAAFGRSLALFALARLILADYVATKRKLCVLDYDDMIARTRALFETVEAAWLIYKLDAGLDHLLVDEAQDTSADQWAILNALSGEFFAGLGQRDPRLARTVFAVGDEKQSIFGFQGAAPAAFAEQRRDLEERLRAIEGPFHDVRLTLSFRSTRDVIAAVDAVFAQADAFRGLSHDPAERGTVHETIRGNDSGAVDLWDLVEPDPALDEVIWTRPVDAVDRQPAVMRLARHIAATLKRWTRDGQDDLGRAFSPGDALILLPKRKGAFAAVVRALKDADVPVAGMDRLKLAEHIAVEDLLALANAALLPEDDLTVAVALRSPLFGFDDDDLLRLAPGRAGSLREALARSDAAQDRAADAHLARIEDLAREVGPFAFFATVLGPLGGRKAMLARLGPEAGDAIDALLARALDHERREGPSLASFVRAVAASDDDVRRDLASASDQVRVMTVHGAKGLEAPVVFIADIGAEPGARELGALMDVMVSAPALSNASVAVPVWTRGVQPKSPLGQARAEAVARAVEESRRLLYVAMTRAEDRLILCGVRPAKPTAFEQSWYAMVDSGLAASAAGLTPMAPLPDGLGVRRFKVTNGPPAAPRAKAEASPRPWVAALPDWALTPLPVEPVAAPPLAPSRLVAADQPPRVGDSAAASPLRRAVAARGRLVHQLLQWLPDVAPAQRPAIAARLAARGWPAAEDAVAARAQQAALVEEVMALFTDPRLADLLGPGGRSEVDLAGSLKTAQGPRPIAGRIDRLLITQAAVIFADYKTTQRPPRDAAQIPAATLAQLAAYRAVLSALYPNRPVRPWLIYTAGPTVIEPSLAQLDGALAGITGA